VGYRGGVLHFVLEGGMMNGATRKIPINAQPWLRIESSVYESVFVIEHRRGQICKKIRTFAKNCQSVYGLDRVAPMLGG